MEIDAHALAGILHCPPSPRCRPLHHSNSIATALKSFAPALCLASCIGGGSDGAAGALDCRYLPPFYRGVVARESSNGAAGVVI